MAVPNDRKYLKTHEWFKVDGNLVTVGITQFAADELTDITYVALPKVGQSLSAGESLGEVESVKATSDVYTAVAGVVKEVNPRLENEPELINTDPFEAGWMVRLECSDLTPLNGLLDGPAYEQTLTK